jgi:hypothetical protein
MGDTTNDFVEAKSNFPGDGRGANEPGDPVTVLRDDVPLAENQSAPTGVDPMEIAVDFITKHCDLFKRLADE